MHLSQVLFFSQDQSSVTELSQQLTQHIYQHMYQVLRALTLSLTSAEAPARSSN